jgi:hypothetical protein
MEVSPELLASPELRRPGPKWVFRAFQAVEVSRPTPHWWEAKELGWLARDSWIAKVVATPVAMSWLVEVIAGTAISMPQATAASKTQAKAATSAAEVKMAGVKRVAVTGLSVEEARAEAKREEVRTSQGTSPAAATREAPSSPIARTVHSDCGYYRKAQAEARRTAAGTWAATAWAAEEVTMPAAAAVGPTTAEGAPADPPRGQMPSARSNPFP